MTKPSRNELIAMRQEAAAEEQEVTPVNQPDNVPAHVWRMIMENGELATERLNEILRSPRFARLKAADQAKLIALAQTRAYGTPPAQERKKKATTLDFTGKYFEELADRSSLPEYNNKDT